jgi:predicted DsbA family dithiol-disulfide isomerase
MLTDAVVSNRRADTILSTGRSHPCIGPVLAPSSPQPNNVRTGRTPRKNHRYIRLCLFPLRLSLYPPLLIFPQICTFCYIANKSLHDAIEACRDLPIRFDVEFRPFTLLCSSTIDANKGTSRRAYLAKKLGKEQAEAKYKFGLDMAQKAGLTMYVFIFLPVTPSREQSYTPRAEDGVICRSIQAHRLSVKAYQVGGQEMQQQLNSLIFDACFAKGEDISRDNFLADVAVKAGLMNRERVCLPILYRPLGSDTFQAVEFLKSTEALDCVEKMISAARANGVDGVPFIIIDGKWALNGVQPMDCYVQVSPSFFRLPHHECPLADLPKVGLVIHLSRHPESGQDM